MPRNRCIKVRGKANGLEVAMRFIGLIEGKRLLPKNKTYIK
tara:strand:+ start:39 stop:161 length:123 start_codon:yes stop_codon:yes gene_type:complete